MTDTPFEKIARSHMTPTERAAHEMVDAALARGLDLFHEGDRAYATVNDPRVFTVELKTRCGLGDWLVWCWLKANPGKIAPGVQAVGRAIGMLRTRALYDSPEREAGHALKTRSDS